MMQSCLGALQNIAVDWGIRCFGIAHIENKAIRALRFAEEAIELGQACGVPKDTMAKLVEVVYSRPSGTITQELGGCMVTLSVLGYALNIGLEEAFEREVRRCLSKTAAEFAQRNREKLDLGLDAG